MKQIALFFITVALVVCMLMMSLALELRAGWAALYFAVGVVSAVLAIFLLCRPGERR